jgi:hypothetical protein
MSSHRLPSARSPALSDADKAAQEEAHDLLAEAGSDQAQRAVESAVGQEADTPKREAFARRWNFGSYLDLFEASKPLTTTEGKHWLATNLAGDQWIVWNEQELEVAYRVGSMDEAQQVLVDSSAARQSDRAPPTG